MSSGQDSPPSSSPLLNTISNSYMSTVNTAFPLPLAPPPDPDLDPDSLFSLLSDSLLTSHPLSFPPIPFLQTSFAPDSFESLISSNFLSIRISDVCHVVEILSKPFTIGEFHCHREIAAALSGSIRTLTDPSISTYSTDCDSEILSAFISFLNGSPLNLSIDQITSLTQSFNTIPLTPQITLQNILTLSLLRDVPPTFTLTFTNGSFLCNRILAATVSKRITDFLLEHPTAIELSFPFNANCDVLRSLMTTGIIESCCGSFTAEFLALECHVSLPSLLSPFWEVDSDRPSVKKPGKAEILLSADALTFSSEKVPYDFEILIGSDVYKCHKFVLQSVSVTIREFLHQFPGSSHFELLIEDPNHYFQFVANWLHGESVHLEGKILRFIGEIALILNMFDLLPSIGWLSSGSSSFTITLNRQLLLNGLSSIPPDFTVCINAEKNFECSYFIVSCLSSSSLPRRLNLKLSLSDAASFGVFIDFLNYQIVQADPTNIGVLCRAALALNIITVFSGSINVDLPGCPQSEIIKVGPGQLMLSQREIVEIFRTVPPYFSIETRTRKYPVHLPLAVFFSATIAMEYMRLGRLNQFRLDTDLDLSWVADFLN
jgi:hypothetical protein